MMPQRCLRHMSLAVVAVIARFRSERPTQEPSTYPPS